MRRDVAAEPWLSFLTDLDAALDETTELHCMGGFAVVQAYGLERATADIDVLCVVPTWSSSRLVEVAGKESQLRRKHGVYLDVVTVAAGPVDYASLAWSCSIRDSRRTGRPPATSPSARTSQEQS